MNFSQFSSLLSFFNAWFSDFILCYNYGYFFYFSPTIRILSSSRIFFRYFYLILCSSANLYLYASASSYSFCFCRRAASLFSSSFCFLVSFGGAPFFGGMILDFKYKLYKYQQYLISMNMAWIFFWFVKSPLIYNWNMIHQINSISQYSRLSSAYYELESLIIKSKPYYSGAKITNSSF